MKEITPQELQEMLGGDEPPLLVDVREPIEAAIAQIAGSTLIPMGSLPHHLQEIPREGSVLICPAQFVAASRVLLIHSDTF